jgi:hypothetical protein
MNNQTSKLEIEDIQTLLDNMFFNVETRLNASTGNYVYLSVNYKGEYFVKYNNHIGTYSFTTTNLEVAVNKFNNYLI